ncbi:MAG TPA: cytochrome P450 [Nocardioides sp.]|nr:cytochrome P450 [Nocardioides sp.]
MIDAPAIDFEVYDHRLQDDPWPVYRRLRDEAPLFHQVEHDYWVLSRHADVHSALRDEDTFSHRMGASLDASAWNEHAHLVMSFLATDAPEQPRLRRLVSQAFTPRRIAELTPQIDGLATHYLDRVPADGELDWVTDVAARLPMDVISDLMGVPAADREEVRRLADLLVHREDGLRDVPAVGSAAGVELFGYYRGLIAEKRKRPADDMVSALLTAEDEGQRMTDPEINAFLFLMVVAGNETTTKLLGNAVFHLTCDPAQHEEVFADPGSDLVEPWIQETLRHDTSTQFVARLLTADLTRHGVTAPAGSQLVLALGAANHDDRVFTDPHRFDLHRDPDELSRQISFGGGRHFCLGANLARLEARVVLTQLVRRCRRIEVDHQACRRVYSANVRGFGSVPMRVTAR